MVVEASSEGVTQNFENFKFEHIDFLVSDRRVQPTRGYKSSLFSSGDLKIMTLFDKYTKLVNSLSTHFCIIGNEVGLVKAAPRSGYQENDGEGYLLFGDI